MGSKIVPDSNQQATNAETFFRIIRMYAGEPLDISTVLHMEDSLNQTFEDRDIDGPVTWFVGDEFKLAYHQCKIRVFINHPGKINCWQEILQH